MKSRSSSPQTSPQVLRRIRVDSSPVTVDAPQLRKSSLRIEELPDITMNGAHPFGGSISANSTSPRPGLLTPIQNGSRRTSAENVGAITPSRLDSLRPNGTPNGHLTQSPPSATSENSPSTWSSAVGPATNSGKSGRVIERLMSENDKLKRDLNEQMIRCQELERNLQTYKPQIEALRQENDNLTHARGVDSNLIARRDRKIEELKAEMATERQRRETAEALARQREREKEDMEEQTKREAQSMMESTKHATLHAEILETSHRQLAAEYRARGATWKKDLSDVAAAREQDRTKLSRLDVVADQMRQELERSKRLNGGIVEAWARLRQEQEARLKGIEDENARENERSYHLSAEMDKVVNEMRWLMGVKNVQDGNSG